MIACPICGGTCHILTAKKDRLGNQYEYAICESCRFLFEKDLALGSKKLQEKVSKLYGEDYFLNVDTGWQGRADGYLKVINGILFIYHALTFKKRVSILDYGGGNGYLASLMNRKYKIFYYDKYEKPTFLGDYTVLDEPVKTDVLCAVELVEHVVDIKEWNFLKQLRPDIFMFTTCLVDMIGDSQLPDWEYLHADGGHTAMYSSRALYLLAKKYGYGYVFFPNITSHIFFKSKLLSKINFARLEYFFYNILRSIKNRIK